MPLTMPRLALRRDAGGVHTSAAASLATSPRHRPGAAATAVAGAWERDPRSCAQRRSRREHSLAEQDGELAVQRVGGQLDGELVHLRSRPPARPPCRPHNTVTKHTRTQPAHSGARLGAAAEAACHAKLLRGLQARRVRLPARPTLAPRAAAPARPPPPPACAPLRPARHTQDDAASRARLHLRA